MTETQFIILRHANRGRSLVHGAHGRSEHGGRASSIGSCRRRGWLRADDMLTNEGHAALLKEETRREKKTSTKRKAS